MATATKKKKDEAPVSAKPVKGQPRLNPDGTPWVPAPKRSNQEILADYVKRRAEYVERSNKILANFDAKIAYFTNLGTGKEEAAKELLAGGMTPAEIKALRAKLEKAEAALKGKSPEEIAALTAEAQAEKAAKAEEVPPFLATPGSTDEEESEEDEDEE